MVGAARLSLSPSKTRETVLPSSFPPLGGRAERRGAPLRPQPYERRRRRGGGGGGGGSARVGGAPRRERGGVGDTAGRCPPPTLALALTLTLTLNPNRHLIIHLTRTVSTPLTPDSPDPPPHRGQVPNWGVHASFLDCTRAPMWAPGGPLDPAAPLPLHGAPPPPSGFWSDPPPHAGLTHFWTAVPSGAPPRSCDGPLPASLPPPDGGFQGPGLLLLSTAPAASELAVASAARLSSRPRRVSHLPIGRCRRS